MAKRKALIACALIVGGAGALLAQSAPAPISPAAPSMRLGSAGYLGADRLPDGIALLPPPPAAGSRALRQDRAGEARALAQRGTPRWDLATRDADIFTPTAVSPMSCAAGLEISPQATPRLYALLRRVMPDLGRASLPAKDKYNRPRPFVGNGAPICTPEQTELLRHNGSYPSGHATIGYGWALILSDLLPARRAALLARGRAFGDSRRVCNVHFRSDIAAGQALALPVLAKFRENAAYQADFAAARDELRHVARTAPSCAAERAALKDVR